MVKKSIQIYVTQEGKEAALEITKKAKEKQGTSARQAIAVSEALINYNNLVAEVEELKHIIKSLEK